jgi:MoxR-like ATPase
VSDESGALANVHQKLLQAISPVVVGQEDVLHDVVVALAVGGHVLLEGVPGVAKTLLARSVAASLGISYRRVQCTPDMLPSDITGTMTLRGRELSFRPGPVFTNVLLVDEINRTPPKTQAALLEAMQERQVTVEGEARPLPDPFLVLATENPIEYEGTYPLPEAQLDRFLVQVQVGYPDEAAERTILRLPRRGLESVAAADLPAVVGAKELAAAQAETDDTLVSDEVIEYTSAVIRRTRELPSVSLGASPRAGVHLLAAGRAAARIAGRSFVTPDDIVRMAPPVIAHRLVLRPEAELERYTNADAVAAALASVPVPR